MKFSHRPWFYRNIIPNSLHEIPEDEIGSLEKASQDIQEQKFYQSIENGTRKALYGGMIIIMAALLAWMVYGGIRPSHTHLNSDNNSDQSLPHTCGNSSVEALALGCTFDQLTWAWNPPNCPHYKNEEFINAEETPWRYYDNLYHGKVVRPTDENWYELLDSGVQLWGELREHLTHCVYLLLAASQIAKDGGRHIPKLTDEMHLEHCGKILLDHLRQDSKWNDIDTQVPLASYDQTC